MPRTRRRPCRIRGQDWTQADINPSNRPVLWVMDRLSATYRPDDIHISRFSTPNRILCSACGFYMSRGNQIFSCMIIRGSQRYSCDRMCFAEKLRHSLHQFRCGYNIRQMLQSFIRSSLILEYPLFWLQLSDIIQFLSTRGFCGLHGGIDRVSLRTDIYPPGHRIRDLSSLCTSVFRKPAKRGTL